MSIRHLPDSPPPENPRPYRRIWAAAKADYLAGAGAPEVCERHGLALSTFRYRAAQEGWRRRDHPESPCDSPHAAEPEPAPPPAEPDAPRLDPEAMAAQLWRQAEIALHHGNMLEARGWLRAHRDLTARIERERAAREAVEAALAKAEAAKAEQAERERAEREKIEARRKWEAERKRAAAFDARIAAMREGLEATRAQMALDRRAETDNPPTEAELEQSRTRLERFLASAGRDALNAGVDAAKLDSLDSLDCFFPAEGDTAGHHPPPTLDASPGAP